MLDWIEIGLHSFKDLGFEVLGTGTIFAILRRSRNTFLSMHRLKQSVSTFVKTSLFRQMDSIAS
jgi:hypothetical protein